MYSTRSWTRMLVFFLIFLAPSFFGSFPDLARVCFFTSERLLVSAVRSRRFVRDGAHRAASGATAWCSTLTAVSALHLGGGPTEARADFVGDHLDHAALVP